MRSTLLFHLLMLSVNGQVLKFSDETPEIIRDSETVTNDWEEFEKVLKNLVNQGMKSLLPLLMEDMGNLNISSTCSGDAMQVIGGMRKLKTWAMRFFDSTAKGLDGMLTGTMFSFGAYDECLDTVAINQRSGKKKGQVMFTGKYCMLRIKPHLPPKKKHYKHNEIIEELKGIHSKGTILSVVAEIAPLLYSFPFRIGLCVPSGCSVDDINHLFERMSNYTKLYMKVKRCEVKEEPKYTPRMIFVISLYSFSGFLVLLGTLTDVYIYFSEKKSTNTFVRVLLAFSFISNFKKLMDTSTASKPLSCLNGIRFLTISWIILEHSYLLVLFQIVNGLTYVKPMLEDFAFQAVVLPTVSVDTFFFLGGFLMCYATTKLVIIDKRNLNIFVYIVHRLWRILPVLIFVVLYVFIAELVASGPLAHNSFKPFVEGCNSNWWATLLFINNFYDSANPCLTHTWYLSMDMQLYIGALIILIPLFRWPKIGISIAVCITVASVIVSAIVVYVKNLPPTFIVRNMNPAEFSAYLTEFYFKPYPHIGPYIIGILSGYFLVMNPNLKIPKMIQWLGWPCAVIFSTAALYGSYDWSRGRDPTLVESILYASCHRIAWVLSIAWMVICCATGHGGIVNYILSWTVWIPLGRLSYMAYLVHFLVLMSFLAVFRTSIAPIHTIGVWLYFGHLMATYGIAFVGVMLIESPFMALKKLFLTLRDDKNSSKAAEAKKPALDTMKSVKDEDILNLRNTFNRSVKRNGTENEGFEHRLECNARL